MKEETSSAVAFLVDHFYGLPGYAQVVAIGDHGIVEVAHAKCDGVEKFKPFIEKHNGTTNIYYCVNPLKHPVHDEKGRDKKASEGDILCAGYLHVDIDPQIDLKNGCDLKSERKRILKALKDEDLSVLIDSGGGYQALWKLKECCPIKDADDMQRIKAFNVALRVRYGGDACQDLCRLLRAPGTWNVLNAKKREQGREPALAKVVRVDD